MLESIKRRCRYELFGCDFAFHESSVLVAHEKVCDLRPEGAADDLGSAEDSSDGEGEHVDEAGVGQEEQLDAVNNPMFLNLVFFYDTRPFLHFYAVAVVFLRTFISHFGDVKRPSGKKFMMVESVAYILNIQQETGLSFCSFASAGVGCWLEPAKVSAASWTSTNQTSSPPSSLCFVDISAIFFSKMPTASTAASSSGSLLSSQLSTTLRTWSETLRNRSWR